MSDRWGKITELVVHFSIAQHTLLELQIENK
jgi:hypothetical protein